MKHKKQLIMILIIVFLLVGLGTLAAADVTKNDTSVTKSADVTKTNTASKDMTSASKVQTTQKNDDNNKIVETKTNTKTNEITDKTIKKTDITKNLKTAGSYTENVTNYAGLVTAVKNAKNSNYDEYTINLTRGDYTATQEIIWENSQNTKTIIIEGNNNTLNGNISNIRFITIAEGHNLTINNITIQNYTYTSDEYKFLGDFEYYGGAILNSGNLTITNTIIKNNHIHLTGSSNSFGGAINNNGTLTIKDSNITQNTATDGGAINNQNGTININNSNLTHNNATGGGAISNWKGTININNSNLTHNNATNPGGAITNYATLNINNTNLTHNNATYGGAIDNNWGTLNINNSNLNYNNATYGGAISNWKGTININNSNLTHNDAKWSGGTIYNNWGTLNINNSNLNYNNADRYGGAITNYATLNINNTNLTHNNATYGGAIYNDGGTLNITNNKFIQNFASEGSAIHIERYYYDSGFNKIFINKNVFLQNKANTTQKTVIVNKGNNTTIKSNINDKTSKYYSTIFIKDSESDIVISENNFKYIVSNTKIDLTPIKGIIGENIILKATVTDNYGNKITGGNLAFKLNGKTLRTDGRFDSKANTMKLSVKNGLVTLTIKADLYLRNVKNLTASYSGTSIYDETTSPSVTAQIQKRKAQITITTTPTRAKQYETLTFKITAKDITKNGKNNTLISDNTKVILKVNGVTLKNNKGKTLYITLDKKAQATYKYTIPAGTGGITVSKAQRNYKVEAIFVGDNYYPGARNSTSFQVERSPTTVTITQAKVTKTNVLNVKAMLKDYKGNNLIGTNKVTIKINGKSYTKNGKPVYWTVKNGNVDLMGIQIDPKTTIKRVMLVTDERQAYTEGRTETTNILKA